MAYLENQRGGGHFYPEGTETIGVATSGELEGKGFFWGGGCGVIVVNYTEWSIIAAQTIARG